MTEYNKSKADEMIAAIKAELTPEQFNKLARTVDVQQMVEGWIEETAPRVLAMDNYVRATAKEFARIYVQRGLANFFDAEKNKSADDIDF
jgi:hypothetical protein